MATETFRFEGAPGVAHYLAFFNDAGEVFDFDDETFKALAGATTPYVASTERTDMGGSSKSGYTAPVDLALLNDTGLAGRYTASWYTNTTLATLVSQALDVTVQFGSLGEFPLECGFEATMTSSAGLAVRMLVWLERAGQRIDLAAGTCQVDVREQGAGVDLFSVSDAAPNAAGYFELTQATPGFTDDRAYTATITIVENGNTYVFIKALSVFG